MLKLVLELSFCEGVSYRVVVVLQAIHGLDLRLVSPRSRLGTSLLPGCTINFRLGQTSFLVRDGVLVFQLVLHVCWAFGLQLCTLHAA